MVFTRELNVVTKEFVRKKNGAITIKADVSLTWTETP